MKFKIIILLFLVAIGVFSFSIITTKAIDYGLSDSAQKAGYIEDAKKPGGRWADLLPLIGEVLGIVLAMIGVALFGLLLYGGLRWLISRGNQEDITKAQDIIQAALIGMAIIFVSLGVGNWVIGKLVGGGSAPQPASCILLDGECVDAIESGITNEDCIQSSGTWRQGQGCVGGSGSIELPAEIDAATG